MSGRLGAYDLTGGIPQSLYQGDTEKYTVATLNITNRGNESVRVRAAITDLESTIDLEDYIEFDITLAPKGTLVRTGIIVPSTKYITVLGSASTVNAVAWGIRSGDLIETTAIGQNLGNPPVWITEAGSYTIDEDESIDFTARANVNSTVTYSLASGTLPPGATLDSSTGTISGFNTPVSLTPYTFTLRATSVTGLTTDRIFTLTVNLPPAPTVFSYTGGDQTYTVPAGRTSIAVYLWGAGGTGGGRDSAGETSAGGGGGAVEHTTLSVTPGEVLTLRVGQGPSYTQTGNGTTTNPLNGTTAFGGGGYGGIGDGAGANGTYGGNGGGATSLFRNGTSTLIAQAGGGGGGGGAGYNTGGNAATGGAGGTATGAGGSGAGSTAQAGTSGTSGGGGGGGGGSGSSQAAGNGQPGQGGANIVPSGGTGYTGSGSDPGNNSNPYYPSGIGVGSGIIGASNAVAAGHGSIVIVA